MASSIGDIVVYASILPFDFEDLPEICSLESFKLFQFFSIQSPCLASVEQGGDDNCAEQHGCCSEGESVVVEYALAESFESPMSGFNAVVNVSSQCSGL